MFALSNENRAELREIAAKIVAPGKGILAADEKTEGMGQKFQPLGLENTPEMCRLYRQILLCDIDPKLGQYLGGVIMAHETFHDFRTDDSRTFVQCAKDLGITPGIKVDQGLMKLFPGSAETTTAGFDGLAERCAQYKREGAQFAKWLCVFNIDMDKNLPSSLAISENANVLARYASVCQQNGLVPIVEPMVSSAGSHTLEQCQYVTEKVLAETYKKLNDWNVYLEGTLLKPNMVTAGDQCNIKYSHDQIAVATVEAFRRTVPAAVPGVCFLSGGQSEQDATENLSAINKVATFGKNPWKLTFSYGRALQASVVKAWHGKQENVKQAQQVFLQLCRNNSEASLGKYGSSS